jgi:hypothetical protein
LKTKCILTLLSPKERVKDKKRSINIRGKISSQRYEITMRLLITISLPGGD